MHISASFDSGNIEVVDASDPADIQLQIRKDVAADHRQWFHFRLSGARGVPCRLRIVDAGTTSYPKGWEGYQAVYSTDREDWRRAPTRYADGVLTIEHTPPTDAVWYAYFAPYSWERHQSLIARTLCDDRARGHRLGVTVDGRDLDMLQIGEDAPDRLQLWFVARQHPGETMAEWWAEGLLERLLDRDDPLSRWLLDRAVFYVVPNMNPDGSVRGHLRTNAAGVNLNRAWDDPDPETAPEVALVLKEMDARGVDLCFDVHGDEGLPYNFFSAAEGIPGWTSRLSSLTDRLSRALQRANPDFQRVYGYKLDRPGEANMSMCTSQIAERFNCLAVTLEQPFKDNADRPDPARGWSPDRCKRLGASALDAVAAVIEDLR